MGDTTGGNEGFEVWSGLCWDVDWVLEGRLAGE